MFRFGILTLEQYARAARQQRLSDSPIDYGLLQISDHPTREEIIRFEEVSLRCKTSNGTTRSTFRGRLLDVDEITLGLLAKWHAPQAELRAQDRAASTCLTSTELAQKLFQKFPNAGLEASDRLLHLLKIPRGKRGVYIAEPSGEALQYIRPPFVIRLISQKPYRCPLRRFMAARAMRSYRELGLPERGSQGNIEEISCVHPEALALSERDRRFQICARSVFEVSAPVDVLRTLNIFNTMYFPKERILEGAKAAFLSLKVGGLWIVGRTIDATNHVTFFRRGREKWEVVAQLGAGAGEIFRQMEA